jgi:hypothetical protein
MLERHMLLQWAVSYESVRITNFLRPMPSFVGSLLPSRKCSDGSHFPSRYCVALTQLPRTQLVKIKPLFCKCQHNISFSGLCNSTLIHKPKIRRPLSQATAHNHRNVFTLTLALSAGRAGETFQQNIPISGFQDKLSLRIYIYIYIHMELG